MSISSSETFDDSELKELGKGVVEVIHSFPPHSHFKQPLLGALSSFVPLDILSKTLDSSPHARNEYLARCQKVPIAENELLNSVYPAGTHKTKNVKEDCHEELVQFFLSTCKAENNPYGTHLVRFVEETELFHMFKLQSSSKGIGMKTFLRVLSELHILKAKHYEFDLFYCKHCHQLDNIKFDKNADVTLMTTEEQKKYLELVEHKKHRAKVVIQWRQYKDLLLSLVTHPDRALVVIDFSKKFTQAKKSIVCSLIIFRLRNEIVNWMALDFCGLEGSEPSNNYFVFGAWLSSFRLGILVSLSVKFFDNQLMILLLSLIH